MLATPQPAANQGPNHAQRTRAGQLTLAAVHHGAAIADLARLIARTNARIDTLAAALTEFDQRGTLDHKLLDQTVNTLADLLAFDPDEPNAAATPAPPKPLVHEYQHPPGQGF